MKHVDDIGISNKVFLSPNDIMSKAVINTRIFKKPHEYIKRPCTMLEITDCKNSIMITNTIDNKDGREKILSKIDVLISHLKEYKNDLNEYFKQNKL